MVSDLGPVPVPLWQVIANRSLEVVGLAAPE